MKLNYFNYKKFKDKFMITNEQGSYCFIEKDTLMNLVQEDFEQIPERILRELKEKYFVYDETREVFVEKVMMPYRNNKQYLFSATCLHIFVLTNACNMCCVYCQAQDSEQIHKGIMDKETARRAVDIALQSPSDFLTFEFQGGEPLTCFETIKYIVEYSERNCNDKKIQYSVVTNTLLLNEEMISFFKEHYIVVSTSLDGNEQIHNTNRPTQKGDGTYEIVKNNIFRLKNSGISVGAIQTTTKKSLEDPKAIIDAYLNVGLQHIFIRPLTPLGYAKEHWDEVGYSPEEFIHFYKRVIHILLEYNKKGVHIVEGHAQIFLRKILAGYSDNYMELRSPCGATVGQLAYYYDGNIYTCDEGRMMAEMGNTTFRLGNVYQMTYDDLMESNVCKITCQSSVLESLPSCCDCVYHPYCGVCPVINLAMENHIYERTPNNYRCQMYKGILDTLFECMYLDEEAVSIFKTWI